MTRASPALLTRNPSHVSAPGMKPEPHLPISSFTSTEQWNPERIGALAIYCSDGRWGDAFDEFCHRSLNIPRYDRFAVPGGPAWLNQMSTGHPELYTAARAQLDFLVRVHNIGRVILITHYGCAFYTEEHHCEPDECLPTQIEDLKQSAGRLKGWYPQISVEPVLAMRRENRLSFHPVTFAQTSLKTAGEAATVGATTWRAVR
jgi:hypothetical protein